MTRALYPFCRECGESKGVAVATLSPGDDGFHHVERFLLECGDVVDDPDTRVEDGVVDLLLMHRPDTVEVQE